MVNRDDIPIASVVRGDASWHDGEGWYYWDDEYRDEGSVGAFATRQEAEEHALAAGYRLMPTEDTPRPFGQGQPESNQNG